MSTIDTIVKELGSQYLRYTMLLAYTENRSPLVFYATKADWTETALTVSIRVFGRENYELVKQGVVAECSFLNLLVKEETHVGTASIKTLEENYFNIWTLGQLYNSLGVRGLATFERRTQNES